MRVADFGNVELLSNGVPLETSCLLHTGVWSFNEVPEHLILRLSSTSSQPSLVRLRDQRMWRTVFLHSHAISELVLHTEDTKTITLFWHSPPPNPWMRLCCIGPLREKVSLQLCR